jgi:hypothetical protein
MKEFRAEAKAFAIETKRLIIGAKRRNYLEMSFLFS